MKKLLLIALLFISVKSFAQVTFEQSYPLRGWLYKSTSTEWDYCTEVNNEVSLYDINHNLIESFSPTIPSGYSFVAIWSLSKNLFSLDNKYTIGYTCSNSSSGIYESLVSEDDGITLLQVDSAYGGEVYNTSAGTKLLLVKGPFNATYSVYSLPGTFYATDIAHPQGSGSDVGNAFLNPTTDAIHLPYSLNNGDQGELDIVNMNGQTVKQYKVTGAFNDVLIYGNDLPKGSYLYYLSANGTKSEAKQFVVQ